MPEQMTHSDSLRTYRSGASADGGTVASDDLSLGNYRSATEETFLSITRASPTANISIDYAAAQNGAGNGTLTVVDANNVTWTGPGDAAGAAVTIANGESKLIESTTTNQCIRISRTSATALVAGSETVTLALVRNNAVGMDNVSPTDAAAGTDRYRAVCVRNENAFDVDVITFFVKTLGTQRVTNTARLGASGSGTITTTGSFADWPASGFGRITDNTGVLREIVYYSSRTSTSLTVPSFGRALLGTTAAAGVATDTVDAVPGIRIATEAPSAQPAGHAQTIADETTAPTGRTWSTAISSATGINIGTLTTGQIVFLWIHRAVPAGMIATAAMDDAWSVNFSST